MFSEDSNDFPAKPVRKMKICNAAHAACKFILVKAFHAASLPHTLLKSLRQSEGKALEDVCPA